MKRFLMAAAAVAAFASNGVAHAADMGLPIAPPVYVPPPAVLSWTGPYVGLNGGGGWGTTDHTFTGVVAGLTASTGNFKTSGGLAGGTWGYNYQVGAWVFGAESDLDWANIRGTFTAAIPGVVTGSQRQVQRQHRSRRFELEVLRAQVPLLHCEGKLTCNRVPESIFPAACARLKSSYNLRAAGRKTGDHFCWSRACVPYR